VTTDHALTPESSNGECLEHSSDAVSPLPKNIEDWDFRDPAGSALLMLEAHRYSEVLTVEVMRLHFLRGWIENGWAFLTDDGRVRHAWGRERRVNPPPGKGASCPVGSQPLRRLTPPPQRVPRQASSRSQPSSDMRASAASDHASQ
jgi:hypothetical protein